MSPDPSYPARHEMVHYASAWPRLFLLWTFSLPLRPKMAQTPHLGISRASQQLFSSSYFPSSKSYQSLRFDSFSLLLARINSTQLSSAQVSSVNWRWSLLPWQQLKRFRFGAWPCVKATHLIWFLIGCQRQLIAELNYQIRANERTNGSLHSFHNWQPIASNSTSNEWLRPRLTVRQCHMLSSL